MMFKATPKSKGDTDKELLAGIEHDEHSEDETPDARPKPNPLYKNQSMPYAQSENDLLGNKPFE